MIPEPCIEIRPCSFDLEGGFIHAPGVIGGFEVWSALFVEIWGIAALPSGKWWYDRH
jgi:hypothetical protein